MSVSNPRERAQAAPGARPSAQPVGRVMAFLCDDVTRQTMSRIATDAGWRQPLVELGGIASAVDQLTGGLSPDLLFVDLSESADPLAEINALADVCDPETRVIAFGTTNDVKLYRGLIASGLVDYLVKPVNPADILRAVSEAVGTTAESRAATQGKLCIVTGTRGGVGASMVAASLAWVAAEKYKEKTALLDLDLRFGVTALTFDAAPGSGLAEMLADPDRIDTLFLDRASVMVTSHLALFATEAPLVATLQLRPDAIRVLAKELLGTHDRVIVDMPRDLLASQPDLLAIADTAVLVGDLSLAGMRDAMRLRSLVVENGARTRLRLVENQARPPSGGELPRAEFEKTVGEAFAATIPFDRKAAGDAEGRGRPIVACAGKAAAAIAGFADSLFAPEGAGAPEKPSIWSFIMKTKAT